MESYGSVELRGPTDVPRHQPIQLYKFKTKLVELNKQFFCDDPNLQCVPL